MISFNDVCTTLGVELKEQFINLTPIVECKKGNQQAHIYKCLKDVDSCDRSGGRIKTYADIAEYLNFAWFKEVIDKALGEGVSIGFIGPTIELVVKEDQRELFSPKLVMLHLSKNGNHDHDSVWAIIKIMETVNKVFKSHKNPYRVYWKLDQIRLYRIFEKDKKEKQNPQFFQYENEVYRQALKSLDIAAEKLKELFDKEIKKLAPSLSKKK